MRRAPDVATEEAFRLVRAMTFKNAAAGLEHGGGKSVIFADPKMPLSDKEPLIRAIIRAAASSAWTRRSTSRAISESRRHGRMSSTSTMW